MKTSRAALCALLSCLVLPVQPVLAQEPEPGVHVQSTENDDLFDVTFTYHDTDAKDAVKVTVTGNMQWYSFDDPVVKAYKSTGNGAGAVVLDAAAYKPGVFNTGNGLNDDSAVYELEETSDEHFSTTLRLPGTLYYYDYTITYADGSTVTMQDPANPSEKNPASGHDSGHSLVYVGDAEHTMPGQEAIYARKGQKGTYSFVNYTAVDGTSQPLGVYLPYGYDSSRTYPTIYVSHGGGGNEAEWMGIGAVPNIMDNLIADQQAVPAVVVTMDHSYFSWNYPQIAENFEKHIIPYIESHYSVSTSREDRAMCGLSMGSMTTTTMMQSYTHLFKYYGCFSGANGSAEITNPELLKDSVIYLTAGNVDMALMNDLDNSYFRKKWLNPAYFNGIQPLFFSPDGCCFFCSNPIQCSRPKLIERNQTYGNNPEHYG